MGREVPGWSHIFRSKVEAAITRNSGVFKLIAHCTVCDSYERTIAYAIVDGSDNSSVTV